MKVILNSLYIDMIAASDNDIIDIYIHDSDVRLCFVDKQTVITLGLSKSLVNQFNCYSS